MSQVMMIYGEFLLIRSIFIGDTMKKKTIKTRPMRDREQHDGAFRQNMKLEQRKINERERAKRIASMSRSIVKNQGC